jgi:uncharacterized protein (DUF58 family)
MAAAGTGSEGRLQQQAEQLAGTLPPLLAKAERVASTVAQGVHGRRRVGTGETFWQFRRYQTGDAAQSIDWRQSAKSQKLFVREHEWEAAQSVWLWRDGSASMRYRSEPTLSEKRERASLLLLALASLLVRGGERVALLGVGERPTTGRIAVRRLAEHLAGQERDTAAEWPSLPEIERLPRFSHVVMISDFLSPLSALEEAVMAFAGAGIEGHLLQILDPAEEDLPFRGRTRFEGLEDEGGVTVGRVESLQAAYRSEIASRREALTRITRRVGWTATSHRTDRPPQTALLALYRAIADDLAMTAW